MHFAVQIGFPGGVVGDFNAACRILRMLETFFVAAFSDKIAGGQIDGGGLVDMGVLLDRQGTVWEKAVKNGR